ncbi:MAG: ComF family protein [Phycisphaerales bacterium]|nr:ComF family protein [Phycisphaerales bacterium]
MDFARRLFQSLLIAERQVFGTIALTSVDLPVPDELGAWCLRCGASTPLAPDRASEILGPLICCARCAGIRLERSATIRLGQHGGALRDAVLRIKFGADLRLAHDIGHALAQQYARACARGDVARCAAVTSVPMPLARRVERGIDHARAIARSFSRSTRLPLLRLLRHDPGPAQALLSGRERRTRSMRIHPRRQWLRQETPGAIIVVDDVLTTGSTAEQAVAALRQERVGSVIVVAVAAVA